MASDESIKKMIHAILEKRQKLGFPDWGQVPIEEVLNRLNNAPPQEEETDSPCEDKKIPSK